MATAGEDTIAALATAEGRGAIAVVRVSGSGAFDIAARHVTPWPTSHRMATLCTVHGRDSEVLDRALVTTFGTPGSFTGEDVVEIATHGGDVVPNLVLASLIGSGARMALPGEFTRRAVLNGKLDLVQAEAVGDLINSTSRGMQRVAISQLDGGLSRRVNELRERVIELEALIAYDIDFPEEDDGPVSRSRIARAAADLLRALDSLLATAPVGELVRKGALVVIAGAPNVGKSSLFNAMLGRSRAIVTDVPGTTRDAIEAVIDADEWPLRLVDTAGLRDTADVVERLGIDVAEQYLAAADVVLACGDSAESVDNTAAIVSQLSGATVIPVRTKADLAKRPERGAVSAVSGAGIRELLEETGRKISERSGGILTDAPMLTRERHRFCVEQARREVSAFDALWRGHGLPAPVAAVHLRSAADALAEVTGTIDVEDVLDRLFLTFCVGK